MQGIGKTDTPSAADVNAAVHDAAHGRRRGAGRQHRGDDQSFLPADHLRLVLPVPGVGRVLRDAASQMNRVPAG